MKKRFLIGFISLFIILLISVVIAYISISKNNFGTLKTEADPKGTILYINDKKYETNSEIQLSPGNYKVEAKKDGYDSEEFTIKIKKNETATYKIVLLTKNENTLLKSLPFENEYYKIDYQLMDGKPIYEISLYAILNNDSQLSRYNNDLKKYKLDALNYIKDFKVDINKIKIEWLPKEAENL